MVLLEVNRDYKHVDRLIGEHRWSEFLKHPTDEETGRVSQIFHCFYNTDRQAQKDGKSVISDVVWILISAHRMEAYQC